MGPLTKHEVYPVLYEELPQRLCGPYSSGTPAHSAGSRPITVRCTNDDTGGRRRFRDIRSVLARVRQDCETSRCEIMCANFGSGVAGTCASLRRRNGGTRGL